MTIKIPICGPYLQSKEMDKVNKEIDKLYFNLFPPIDPNFNVIQISDEGIKIITQEEYYKF